MTERKEAIRRAAESLLELYRMRFENGKDRLALMNAVAICADAGIPIPSWAALPLAQAVRRVRNLDAASWDDALGRPYPPGTKVTALRVHRKKAPDVVWDIFCRARGVSLEAAFRSVGKKHGYSPATAKRMWDERPPGLFPRAVRKPRRKP